MLDCYFVQGCFAVAVVFVVVRGRTGEKGAINFEKNIYSFLMPSLDIFSCYLFVFLS